MSPLIGTWRHERLSCPKRAECAFKIPRFLRILWSAGAYRLWQRAVHMSRWIKRFSNALPCDRFLRTVCSGPTG